MCSRSPKTDPQRALPSKLTVGRIGRAHGLKGEVLVSSQTDVPHRFDAGSRLDLIFKDGARRQVTVATCRDHRMGLLVRFEGCASRTEAEELRGASLEVDRGETPPAPEGWYYHYELFGCSCRDRKQGELGTVIDVVEDGGGLLLKVEDGERSLLVPFVERYIENIDVGAGRIELQLPPGLIETCTSTS